MLSGKLLAVLHTQPINRQQSPSHWAAQTYRVSMRLRRGHLGRVVITKGIGMAKKQTSVRKREREAVKRQKSIEKTRKNEEKRERKLAGEPPVEYVELKY